MWRKLQSKWQAENFKKEGVVCEKQPGTSLQNTVLESTAHDTVSSGGHGCPCLNQKSSVQLSETFHKQIELFFFFRGGGILIN